MLFLPRPLGSKVIEKEALKKDIEEAEEFGLCALGRKALYTGSFVFSKTRYITLPEIRRVYKRLAVSKGFYEANRIYATICYLVVEYKGGNEKAFKFDDEDELNELLIRFKKYTSIPVGKK